MESLGGDSINQITASNFIMIIFALIIFIAFIKLVFFKNTDEYFKKIIGGLSILVFALASKNSYIITIALFIGGLLIATEKFLIHLAGIFSSKGGDDLNTIYTSFSGSGQTIIEEKVTEEEKIEEVKKEEEISTQGENTKSQDTKLIEGYRSLIGISNTIFEIFERQIVNFGNLYIEKDIRIKNEYGTITLDGTIKETGKVIAGIDIKVIRSRKGREGLGFGIDFTVRRAIEKLRFVKLEIPTIIIIGSEHFNENELDEIERKYTDSEDIKLLFYKYTNKVENGIFIKSDIGQTILSLLNNHSKRHIGRLVGRNDRTHGFR